MSQIPAIVDYLKELNILSVIVRILLAIICGGVIGIERRRAHQSAGMRTYMLVCMGAAIVMATGQYMYDTFKTGDPSRLGAQVISGIGFLGAGSIITSGKTKVRGLTTAAGLWVSACIGLLGHWILQCRFDCYAGRLSYHGATKKTGVSISGR